MTTKILDLLKEERIFSVQISYDKTHLELWEACDGYFYHYLTAEQVYQLAAELTALAGELK